MSRRAHGWRKLVKGSPAALLEPRTSWTHAVGRRPDREPDCTPSAPYDAIGNLPPSSSNLLPILPPPQQSRR
jgi:hypothetical protein